MSTREQTVDSFSHGEIGRLRGQKKSLTRPLGCWEVLHSLLHDQANGHGLIGGVVRVAGRLDLALLQQALQALHQRHPLLRARIESHWRRLRFVTDVAFSCIPIEIIDQKNHQWKTLFEVQLSTPLMPSHYLWRACICLPDDASGNTDIVMVMSHSIGDGLSGVSLLQDLLRYYTKLQNGHTLSIESLPLHPAVDSVLSSRRSGDFFALKDQQCLTPWPYLQAAPMDQRRTECVCRSWDIKQLKSQCRSQKVSLHALLNAATVRAAQQLTGAPVSIALQTPIDLRRFCQPRVSKVHLGCYASVLTTYHQDDGAISVWQLAKQYRQALKQTMQSSSFYPAGFKRRKLQAFVEQHCLQTHDHFSLGFGLSSAGKLNVSGLCEAHPIQFIYACPARQAADFVIFICVVIVDDQLMCTFSYTAPMLNRDWVERYVKFFGDTLMSD